MTPLAFSVQVVTPAALDGAVFTDTEADAVAVAHRLLNEPRVEQVTIEAAPVDGPDLSTFAIRHFRHDGTASTLWSCWLDGDFTGPRSTLHGWPR